MKLKLSELRDLTQAIFLSKENVINDHDVLLLNHGTLRQEDIRDNQLIQKKY